jgi:hypothetical protein
MAGASEIDSLQEHLTEAGFTGISIKPKAESREFIRSWAPEHALEDIVVSAVIQATKPAAAGATAAADERSCCSSEEQSVCCEPEAKSDCCGKAETSTCECR